MQLVLNVCEWWGEIRNGIISHAGLKTAEGRSLGLVIKEGNLGHK